MKLHLGCTFSGLCFLQRNNCPCTVIRVQRLKPISHLCEQMAIENEHWLEDLCLRLICVMALDRFGDFIADEVHSYYLT